MRRRFRCMYFHKVHHPANFRFASRLDARTGTLRIGREHLRARLDSLGESAFRIQCEDARWPDRGHRTALHHVFSGSQDWSCVLTPSGGLQLSDPSGHHWLETESRRGFGMSGKAWLFQFRHSEDMQFYGMGEKTLGLELSRQRTKFWNADVWADFNFHRIMHESADPMYLSIPYLIIKRDNTYVGLLMNNPYAAFMVTAQDFRIVPHLDRENQPIQDFYLGAPDGAPDLYMIVGPDLATLTSKLQRLVGVTPRPPLWALGHHQCRWGYRNREDLHRLDREFSKRGIPTDALWLDIDYMHGYRVFTIDSENFPTPKKDLAGLKRRVVPILDPGVKVDPAFPVYRDGLKRDVFCKNPAGTPFVGFVWPGATVFPDFSTKRGRTWWAEQVQKFVKQGFAGAWIDMNDPSTGPSESSEMLFDGGRLTHADFHNLYANGMAESTRAGLLAARPALRTFQLTRSGSIGIAQHAAVWTGDNFSNENHLRRSIPTSLNLALSGVPFNGPDVPGFGGDATPELAITWYKACFLFPFLRNHSAIHTRDQEPWAFGPKTERVIAHLLRLRYKLLPYLYNLFVAQERTGAALLRPLFHDFEDTERLPLGRIEDQFLVGSALMQAPFVDVKTQQRALVLPAARWFDAASGGWVRGSRRIKVSRDDRTTPLFVRDGSVVPMQVGERRSEANDLHDLEMHLFVSPHFRGTAELDYTADDGATFAYAKGRETRIVVNAERQGGRLRVRVHVVSRKHGPIRIRWVTYDRAPLDLVVNGISSSPDLVTHRWRFAGLPLSCRISSPITIG